MVVAALMATMTVQAQNEDLKNEIGVSYGLGVSLIGDGLGNGLGTGIGNIFGNMLGYKYGNNSGLVAFLLSISVISTATPSWLSVASSHIAVMARMCTRMVPRWAIATVTITP